MPVAGWLMGQALAGYISMATPWVAFLLLLIIGGRMLWQSFKKEAAPSGATDYTRGFALFVLAVATSIDALAAGFSFGLLESSVLQACITIGIVAFLASLAGLFLGHFSGTLLGKRAEAVGGLLLIAIGARILIVSLL